MTKFGKLLVAALIIGIGVFGYFQFFASERATEVEEEAPPSLQIGMGTLKGSILDVFYRFDGDHAAKYQEIVGQFQAVAGATPTAIAANANYNHLDESLFQAMGLNAADGLPLSKLLNCIDVSAEKILFFQYRDGHWYGYKGPFGEQATQIQDPAAYKIYPGEGFVLYSGAASSSHCVKSASEVAGLRRNALQPGWNLVAINEATGGHNLARFIRNYPHVAKVWYLADPNAAVPFAKAETVDRDVNNYLVWVKIDQNLAIGEGTPEELAQQKQDLKPVLIEAYCDGLKKGLDDDSEEFWSNAMPIFQRFGYSVSSLEELGDLVDSIEGINDKRWEAQLEHELDRCLVDAGLGDEHQVEQFTADQQRLIDATVEGLCSGIRQGFDDNSPEWMASLIQVFQRFGFDVDSEEDFEVLEDQWSQDPKWDLMHDKIGEGADLCEDEAEAAAEADHELNAQKLRDAYVEGICQANVAGHMNDNGELQETALPILKAVFQAVGFDVSNIAEMSDFDDIFEEYIESEGDLYTDEVIASLIECAPQMAGLFSDDNDNDGGAMGQSVTLEQLKLSYVDAACKAIGDGGLQSSDINLDGHSAFSRIFIDALKTAFPVLTDNAITKAIIDAGGEDAIRSPSVISDIEACSGDGGEEEAHNGGNFSVILVDNGDPKVPTIKAIRDLNPGMSLKDAKDLSDLANGDGKATLKTGLSEQEATQWKNVLEEAGATVEIVEGNAGGGDRNMQLDTAVFTEVFIESACNAAEDGMSPQDISFANPKFVERVSDKLQSISVIIPANFDFMKYFRQNAEVIFTEDTRIALDKCGALNLP